MVVLTSSYRNYQIPGCMCDVKKGGKLSTVCNGHTGQCMPNVIGSLRGKLKFHILPTFWLSLHSDSKSQIRHAIAKAHSAKEAWYTYLCSQHGLQSSMRMMSDNPQDPMMWVPWLTSFTPRTFTSWFLGVRTFLERVAAICRQESATSGN